MGLFFYFHSRNQTQKNPASSAGSLGVMMVGLLSGRFGWNDQLPMLPEDGIAHNQSTFGQICNRAYIGNLRAP